MTVIRDTKGGIHTRHLAVLPGAGLPSWCVVAIEAAIGSGAISWTAIDDLDTRQLFALAQHIVRGQLADVDVAQLVAEVRA